jgi:hypothetical protein
MKNVASFKHLGSKVTNLYSMLEQIKIKINFKNVYNHSVQNLLSLLCTVNS